MLASAALLLALTACSGSTAPPGSATAAPSSSGSAQASTTPHVMVIVMENQEYSDVIGRTDAAPYINQLADRYGLATDFHARTHPSLPNYLDMVAGSTLGITSDCTSCSVQGDGDTIVDQLAKKNIHWTAYMEGMPSTCFPDAASPASTETGYVKKHNPFMYFDHLRSDPSACQNIVPYTQFATDLQSGNAAPFLWVTPNECNDGHNTAPGCGLSTADRWLSNNLEPVLASSWYRAGGIVFLTWDEGSSESACCGGGAHGGKVATLVISASVKPGARLDSPVDHAGLLRTIEALYGVSYLRTASDPQSGDLMPLLGRKSTL
jgi:acid phosphatase